MSEPSEPQRYRPFPGVRVWMHEFVPDVADRYASRLAALRAEVQQSDLDRAVEVATRYAAVDTGAIEGLYSVDRGFTRTIATQAAAWEATLRSHGEHVGKSIQGALDGYEMVLDAVTHQLPVTEAWIRRLHEVMCGSQETFTVHTELGPQQHDLPLGRYKTSPNSPTNASTGTVRHYAPVDDTGPEMARLVEELASEEFAALHPVVQAAYAHYAFVCVHPFVDGNGRVSRALASVYLYRSPGVPLVVFADQRDVYLDALEAADGGRHDAFVRFVEQRVLDAVGLVEAHLPDESIPASEDSLQAIDAITRAATDLAHVDLGAAASRLLSLCHIALVTVIDVTRSPSVALRLTIGDGAETTSSATDLPLTRALRVSACSDHPLAASAVSEFAVFASARQLPSPELVVREGVQESLTVRLDQLVPSVSQVLEITLASWADRQVQQLLARFATVLASRLDESGYR